MIEIKINNQMVLRLLQNNQYGNIEVNIDDNNIDSITPSNMVMLINYYKHIKDNNLKCNFINPNGKEEI